MSTEKWIAGSGVGYAWTACFASADIASLANGSSVLSSQGDITNQTAQDIFADVSFSFPPVTTVAPNKIDLFIYPLNQDGSTYGDNQLTAGTQAAVTPSSSLWCGTFVLPVGTQALDGIIIGIVIPPGTFRFALQNNAGVTMGSGTCTAKYRTYNRSVA
jgi:hypothetical protein